MYRLRPLLVAAAIFGGSTIAGSAQQPAAPSPPPTTPYGSPISLDAAKKAMAAAEAEAVKNNWPMAIVILDSTGHTVMIHKLDNTQYGSIRVAEDKAHTALDFRRPSKVFEDLVAQGGIGMLRSASMERPRSRAASRLLSTAKSLGRSGRPAGRLRKTGRSPKPAPTPPRRSNRPSLLP